MTQVKNRCVVLVLVSIAIVAEARYQYYPAKDSPSNLYKSGYTNLDKLKEECDRLGWQCQGFSSVGWLKSKVTNMSASTTSAMFVKVPGPELPALPLLWPLPTSYTTGGTNARTVTVSPNFQFLPSVTSDILNKAISRYSGMIFGERSAVFPPDGKVATPKYNSNNSNKEISSFVILEEEESAPITMTSSLSAMKIVVDSADETLQLETDESYTLFVGSDGSTAAIQAKTVFGAMRGLETFSQLVQYNYDSHQYEILGAPWNINDKPRFPHRGVLIDTARHYLPERTLKAVIDSLSYAKLNVMHWHAVDAQSFPIECKEYPNLWQGSWTPKERYTQAQIARIVQYAKERGVRVMVEFDGPAHAWSWGVGYPSLLPANFEQSLTCENVCPIAPCDVPLDPSNNLTFTILKALHSEMTGQAKGAGIFPENLYHLGGDEVQTGCWAESQQIVDFMAANNMTSYDQLYMYFVKTVQDMLRKFGRTPVHWEEVFNHFGTALAKDTIIHIWLDHKTLQKVVKAGYRGILSNYDVWYLDHLNVNWSQFYLNDPFAAITEPKEQQLVLGGEVCMWGETVDSSDILTRIWPRAAAFAERVWNYDVATQANAVDLALPRIHFFRCHINERGVNAAPLDSMLPQQPSSCFAS